MKIDNPGSKKAVDLGCSCSTMINENGKGFMAPTPDKKPWERVWMWDDDCPLHCNKRKIECEYF